MSDNNIIISKVKKPKNLKLKPVTPRPKTPRLQLELPTSPKGKFPKTPRLKRPPKTPIPEEKTRKYLNTTNVELPIVGEDIDIAIPEFFASPYKTKTGATRYRLVNPLTKARFLASRKDEPSVKIIRKPIENAVILENDTEPIKLALFSPKDRETINRYFQVVFDNAGKPANQVPNTADFRNKERGRPEILPKNIEVMRSRGQMPNTNVDVFVGGNQGGNFSPRSVNFSEQSYSEPPTPKEKRKNVRRKPLKYADKTPAERRRILQNQKNESGKLARDTEKYGLEDALRLKEEKRQQDSAKGDNWWVTGLVDEIAKISEKKPKKLSKKAEQQIAQQIARGANAGGVEGEGINNIFRHSMRGRGPNQSKVSSVDFKIKNLEEQIDKLNGEITELEKELKEAEDKLELNKSIDLKKIDHIPRRMTIRRNKASLPIEIDKLKKKINKKQKELNNKAQDLNDIIERQFYEEELSTEDKKADTIKKLSRVAPEGNYNTIRRRAGVGGAATGAQMKIIKKAQAAARDKVEKTIKRAKEREEAFDLTEEDLLRVLNEVEEMDEEEEVTDEEILQIIDKVKKSSQGKGLKRRGLNNIFSNIIMPKKGKKICSECGMKNCNCSDDEDIEGMGLYASGSGLYASGSGLYASGSGGYGLYASGGQPPRGRGIKHLHHYHRTEMTGEGIVHHHHHMEGGKISMKSIGADIKKAFSPVQKAFEPVKTAFEKVENVATPYNAEVAAHYLIPAAGAALGGAAGSAIGGPLGGIVGSAGGSYGGIQLTKELGVDDNTTFKGFGMKNKKGSPEAKEWGRRMREARLAKMNK